VVVDENQRANLRDLKSCCFVFLCCLFLRAYILYAWILYQRAKGGLEKEYQQSLGHHQRIPRSVKRFVIFLYNIV